MNDPVDVLGILLQEWTEEQFPLARRSQAEAEMLSHLWFRLAEVVFGIKSEGQLRLLKEMGTLRKQGRTGDPPVRALLKALSQLTASGTRGVFLAVAVRVAVGDLISEVVPAALAAWQDHADAMLPIELMTGYVEGEVEAASDNGLTERAEMVPDLASKAALRFGDRTISGLHVLVALLEGDTVATAALKHLDIEPVLLRDEVEEDIRRRSPSDIGGAADLLRAVELAAQFGRGRGPRSLTTGHLLLGLIAAGGPAAQLLARRGVTAERVGPVVEHLDTTPDRDR